MNNKRVKIIGVPISAVNMHDCIDNIFENIEAVKGNYICVSNVHTTVTAHDDPQYHKVQAESFMSLPDGKPLSIIGKKHFPNMERVTGPDLMRVIFAESKERNLRHFFYGNAKENLEKLIQVLRRDYPYLSIALGAPRQECFCYRMKNRINGVMVGVGGAFNVLAGIVPEAPKWMQNLSLEWLYRLLQEPNRLFKRYAITNTKFLWYVITKK